MMMMKKFLPAFSLLFLYNVMAWAQPVSEDLPRVTECIALVNIKFVPAPGKSPSVQTVIIRDGLVTHTGHDITIPPDAFIIHADSLYAYPAFIDALSHTGIKEESSTPPQGGQGRAQRPPVDEEGNPSHEDAGITPSIPYAPQ
jgi:imidazolonepropionase-like amidohydrolase